MKKLQISLVAVMVAMPMMAQAADIAAATKANIASNTNIATVSLVGGAHDHLIDEINTNRTAINTLNGDASTAGSVANAVAGKQDVIDSTHKLGADLVDDSSSTNKFVTAAEKTTWGAKQAQLQNDATTPADISATVATSVRTTGADDTTLVTEKAVRDAITGATYDDTALSGRVTGLESAVGDNTTGLIKDVADNASAISALETAVGDSNSGLVKDVADNTSAITALNTSVSALESTIGDNTGGLVKDVADNASAIEALQSANNTAKGFNVYGDWADPTTATGSVTITSTGLVANN